MADILCLYYSRTGNTRKTMEAIAGALDAELVELNADRPRQGKLGYLRCAFDAVRKSSHKLRPFQTEKPLDRYRLVILGTPVWAGRCSAVMRSFLKYYGCNLDTVAYVLLRGTEMRHEEVYQQMDHYIPGKHCLGVSLRFGDEGYLFWLRQIVQSVENELSDENRE